MFTSMSFLVIYAAKMRGFLIPAGIKLSQHWNQLRGVVRKLKFKPFIWVFSNKKTPEIIHLFIGFSLVFTIHFAGVPPNPMNFWVVS